MSVVGWIKRSVFVMETRVRFLVGDVEIYLVTDDKADYNMTKDSDSLRHSYSNENPELYSLITL